MTLNAKCAQRTSDMDVILVFFGLSTTTALSISARVPIAIVSSWFSQSDYFKIFFCFSLLILRDRLLSWAYVAWAFSSLSVHASVPWCSPLVRRPYGTYASHLEQTISTQEVFSNIIFECFLLQNEPNFYCINSIVGAPDAKTPPSRPITPPTPTTTEAPLNIVEVPRQIPPAVSPVTKTPPSPPAAVKPRQDELLARFALAALLLQQLVRT